MAAAKFAPQTPTNAGVYDPAEDTWALADAIEADLAEAAWRGPMPRVCCEVGSGTGFVSAVLSHAVARRWGAGRCLCLATDLNVQAARVTAATAALNGQRLVEAVACDLALPLVSRLHGAVDILAFNPPYVPTSAAEFALAAAGRGLAASWAGGPQGTAVLERLLPLVPRLLAPHGRFYLVAVAENEPRTLSERLLALGFAPKLLLSRTAGCERLFVLRFTWKR